MKKLMIFVMMLFIALSVLAQTPAPKEKDGTGTTTNTVVIAETLYSGRFAQVGITFMNTGSASNDISYWIKAYRSESSTDPCRTWTATDLADDDIVNIEINNIYYKITIETESTVDDSHSTYEYQYCLRWF